MYRDNSETVSFIYIFLLFFKYSCLHFYCTIALCPTHPHLPPSNLPPLALSMCPSYMLLDGRSPIFFLLSLSHLLSGYCQFVLYFNVSGSIWLVCFVAWIPLIVEIIWYLSFTAWLISLSIMLSSAIHAVTKDRSSFFFSFYVVFHHINVPPSFFYPPIYSWALRLLLALGYCLNCLKN